jgi:hypothetical protein
MTYHSDYRFPPPGSSQPTQRCRPLPLKEAAAKAHRNRWKVPSPLWPLRASGASWSVKTPGTPVALAVGGLMLLTVWKAPPWVVDTLVAAAGTAMHYS